MRASESGFWKCPRVGAGSRSFYRSGRYSGVADVPDRGVRDEWRRRYVVILFVFLVVDYH